MLKDHLIPIRTLAEEAFGLNVEETHIHAVAVYWQSCRRLHLDRKPRMVFPKIKNVSADRRVVTPCRVLSSVKVLLLLTRIGNVWQAVLTLNPHLQISLFELQISAFNCRYLQLN